MREIYDGQLFIKLKKGFSFPAMDPWVRYPPSNISTLSKFNWDVPYSSFLINGLIMHLFTFLTPALI